MSQQKKEETSSLSRVKSLFGSVVSYIVEPAISGMCMAFGQFFVRKVVFYMHYEKLSFTQTIANGWSKFLQDFVETKPASSSSVASQ